MISAGISSDVGADDSIMCSTFKNRNGRWESLVPSF
jgi:hypothetical protein